MQINEAIQICRQKLRLPPVPSTQSEKEAFLQLASEAHAEVLRDTGGMRVQTRIEIESGTIQYRLPPEVKRVLSGIIDDTGEELDIAPLSQITETPS